uniref:Uncharacterized protein n=1 Tax=Panagrolaimus sp. JU765 TaxID=591449 RepID=A0AC34RFK4_9BILA
MNLPNYLLRLYVNLVPMNELPSQNNFWFVLFQDVSQLLYFAQFALNAFYLICIIYGSPKHRQKHNCSVPNLINRPNC